MSAVSESLFNTLNSHSGIRTLIGDASSPIHCRIYPYVMPQGASIPALVYQDISSTRMNTLSDAGGSGVERYTFQLTAWAKTKNTAEDIQVQVFDAMKSANAFSSVPYAIRGGFEVETRLYYQQRDFSIWFHL